MNKTILFKTLLSLLIIFFLKINADAQTYDVVVAKDGSGNFTSLQAAIDAAPANNTVPYKIFIKNGKYKEKITVPSNKPIIHLFGESVAKVILTYDDYAGKLTACAATVGTQNSASFTVNANDFAATNITFENSHPFGVPDNNNQQAVALLVNADRAVFKNCRFLGNQDTLYLKGNGTPRNYFKNCYIDGNVDFIFGSAIALFDSCVVYAKSRTGTSSSYITAPNTPNGQNYGFVFRDARLPHNTGSTIYYLSRPWPSPSVADTRQKTVFLSSRLSTNINPLGWSTWDGSTVTANLYYGEYKSKYFNGDLVDITARVPWSFQLSQADSSTYTFSNVFGSWDPCTVSTGICNASSTDIAVSNFRGVKGATSSQFDWNISWPITGIQYTLFRSADNVSFAPIHTVTAANDTAINFTYTDATLPAAGSSFYYYLSATKAGLASHITDTISISNAATIAVNASDALSLCGFSQSIGAPSASQTYTVSASNLTNDLVITPPANFEVSSNNTTWFGSSTPLVISPSAGIINTTTIYIRLNATVAGSFSGNIINASTGATSVNVAVTGTAINPPTITSNVLQHWPLVADNIDDASVRSVNVTASVPTFNKLYVSNGTTLPAVPAYSVARGQAFGATANGDGSWGTAAGGPGGNLNRTFYEQFTVTATGASVRIDSLILTSAFYNTSSNTKLGVVYSKTGFTTDDSTTNSISGVDQTSAAVTGTFATPIALANQTAGPSNTYRLTIGGIGGDTLVSGETLTIRLYFSCGSTSNARYAMLKNVIVKGEALTALPVNLLSFDGMYNGENVKLSWKTTNEIDMDKYVVEKSKDGRSFSNIGNINANNTSSYELIDQYPFAGANYYRLRMIEKNGQFKFSKIVLINTKPAAGISVYPNPAKDQVIVLHQKADKPAHIFVYNANGARVLTAPVKQTAVQSAIDVSDLSHGIYLIVYSDGSLRTTATFIKQ